MKDYLKTVAAYLTGWVIAQSVFNRIVKRYRQTDWEDEKADIAIRAADELESRLKVLGAGLNVPGGRSVPPSPAAFRGVAMMLAAELEEPDTPCAYSVEQLEAALVSVTGRVPTAP